MNNLQLNAWTPADYQRSGFNDEGNPAPELRRAAVEQVSPTRQPVGASPRQRTYGLSLSQPGCPSRPHTP